MSEIVRIRVKLFRSEKPKYCYGRQNLNGN